MWKFLHTHCLPFLNHIMLSSSYHTYCSAAFTCAKDLSQEPEWSEREMPAPAIGECTIKPGWPGLGQSSCQTQRLQLQCRVPLPPSTDYFLPVLLDIISSVTCTGNFDGIGLFKSLNLRTSAFPAKGALKPVCILPKDLGHQVPLT